MPLQLFQKKAQEDGVKAIIAVAAGKGGVGKSTVTVNLALALKQLNKTVGVADIDIYGPSLRKLLPEDQLPKQHGETIIPALAKGIKTISMAYFRDEKTAAAVRAPIANGIVKQFVNQVEWGSLDYLLIDFPPGTGDIQLTMSQQANLTGAVIVTTPQELALLDVRKAINLFQQVNVPIIGVIENMSCLLQSDGQKVYPFGKGGGERLAREYGIPFLGQLELDPQLCQASDSGRSIFSNDRGSSKISIAEQFLKLAQALEEQNKLLKSHSHLALKGFELLWKNLPEESNKELQNINNETAADAGNTPVAAAIAVERLEQVDNHHFNIMWTDGKTSRYRLSDLQKHCPCALCSQTNAESNRIKDDVKAEKIVNIGRYALRIQFTSGCTAGIYDFPLLYALAGKK